MRTYKVIIKVKKFLVFQEDLIDKPFETLLKKRPHDLTEDFQLDQKQILKLINYARGLK